MTSGYSSKYPELSGSGFFHPDISGYFRIFKDIRNLSGTGYLPYFAQIPRECKRKDTSFLGKKLQNEIYSQHNYYTSKNVKKIVEKLQNKTYLQHSYYENIKKKIEDTFTTQLSHNLQSPKLQSHTTSACSSHSFPQSQSSALKSNHKKTSPCLQLSQLCCFLRY